MSNFRLIGLLAAAAAVSACAGTQQMQPTGDSVPAGPLPLKHDPRPTTAAITQQDLMTRLYIFADDSMQGRATGTEGYRKGTDYIASELRRLGLQPAGENGSYFQQMPSRAIAEGTRLAVGGQPLALWSDYVPMLGAGSPRAIEGTKAVYGGLVTAWQAGEPPLPADQVAGRVVVLGVAPDGAVSSAALSRLTRGPLADAAAVVVAGLERLNPNIVGFLRRPSFGAVPQVEVPYGMIVTTSAATRILGADPATLQPGARGNTLAGRIVVDTPEGAARNVVAIWPGSDPALRGQYVAVGAHADHVGYNNRPVDHDSLRAFNAIAFQMQGANNDPRQLTIDERQSIRVNVDSLRALRPARLDSISNGADDDGSGSMALLEIAESIARGKEKPKRSVLFVWHAAEELGLLGAQHFVENPTVPRDSIVAQINIDMIGRGSADDLSMGGPGYVGIVGSRRLSTQLGDLVESVNTTRRHGLNFDYGLDADGHPQNIYCRSDHYQYARFGIPIVFFFTGLHADYHQLTDEPQ
ncbi:MAG TPA: M28 family peptidase, partial [Gemmatimonadaceae bacterium]|nr:M28 family peptidase [Gemmatimonadaceae bacterium]